MTDRTNNGRFTKGNPGGPGNPHNAAISRLRKALHAAVTEEDIQAVITVLVEKAKEGNLAAIRELLDRAIGKPTDASVAERLDELEALATALQEQHLGRSS
jgi:folylpolyglutamate synthase/dihydropteroate synthase